MAAPVLEASSKMFWKQGYVIAQALLEPDQLTFARRAMEASLRAGRLYPNPSRIVPSGALNEYAAIGAEILLVQCKPLIETIAGCALIPTYALWRIYETGALLRRHVDRNSCEISVSLPILSDPDDQLWPIHICDLQGEERAATLIPGAGIVYQGCRVPHWREPFRGRRQFQVFLHYVVKDGEQANHAFDGRGALGIVLGDRDKT